jgi:hypothetical protein
MNPGSVLCPGCRLPLPVTLPGTAQFIPCPACERSLLVEVFPALARPAAPARAGEAVLEAGVSSCFYHDQKKAEVACEACGRFLCALCHIDFNGRRLCPSCLQSGQTRGIIPTLEAQRVVWDTAALMLCVAPVVFFPLTFLTAPTALGLAIYSFFRPGSLVRRSRSRAYLAMLASLVQIAVWVAALAGWHGGRAGPGQ